MATHPTYQPLYSDSWALIIGIDAYEHVSPLAHARNDAEAIARTLSDRFAFRGEKITLLVDERATRANIASAFLKFTTAPIGADDRILVFFAGHDHDIDLPFREGVQE